MSGAGKATISNLVEERLVSIGILTEILDGDICRRTISKDLGFSRQDRCENLRRIGTLAFSLSQENKLTLICAINPFEEIRAELRDKYNAKIIYVYCSLNTLFSRDTKGLYILTMLPEDDPNKLTNLTGVNDIYEIPNHPDLVIKADQLNISDSVQIFYGFIIQTLYNQNSSTNDRNNLCST